MLHPFKYKLNINFEERSVVLFESQNMSFLNTSRYVGVCYRKLKL